MHAVDRGPEPSRLKRIRDSLTPKWIAYYRHGRGKKPTDARWREFQPSLSKVFSDICGYCEGLCKGDVDHFRPKSRYPELVYQWDNWVLACPFCNSQKLEKWPDGGFVDPCALDPSEKPEAFFSFDTKTGEIVPRPGQTEARRERAVRMIEDLKLNNYHHLKKRVQWLTAVDRVLVTSDSRDAESAEFIGFVVSRERELSSLVREFLRERHFWNPE